MDYSVDEAERRRRRTDRARKGGQALLDKYGREHFSRMGRRGGRPTFWQSLDNARAQGAEDRDSRPKPGRPRTSQPAGAKEV